MQRGNESHPDMNLVHENILTQFWYDLLYT